MYIYLAPVCPLQGRHFLLDILGTVLPWNPVENMFAPVSPTIWKKLFLSTFWVKPILNKTKGKILVKCEVHSINILKIEFPAFNQC